MEKIEREWDMTADIERAEEEETETRERVRVRE